MWKVAPEPGEPLNGEFIQISHADGRMTLIMWTVCLLLSEWYSIYSDLSPLGSEASVAHSARRIRFSTSWFIISLLGPFSTFHENPFKPFWGFSWQTDGRIKLLLKLITLDQLTAANQYDPKLMFFQDLQMKRQQVTSENVDQWFLHV